MLTHTPTLRSLRGLLPLEKGSGQGENLTSKTQEQWVSIRQKLVQKNRKAPLAFSPTRLEDISN